MYEELVNTLLYDAGWLEQGMTQTEHDIAEHLKKAADAIEELSKQNEKWEAVVKTALDFIPCWVSVEERLPENDGRYLVCNQPYKAQWVMIQEYWRDSGWSGSSVTHWMPLPEPPKEEA